MALTRRGPARCRSGTCASPPSPRASAPPTRASASGHFRIVTSPLHVIQLHDCTVSRLQVEKLTIAGEPNSVRTKVVILDEVLARWLEVWGAWDRKKTAAEMDGMYGEGAATGDDVAPALPKVRRAVRPPHAAPLPLAAPDGRELTPLPSRRSPPLLCVCVLSTAAAAQVESDPSVQSHIGSAPKLSMESFGSGSGDGSVEGSERGGSPEP